jgi:hypothetical protein
VSQVSASKPRPDRRNTAEPEESVTVSQAPVLTEPPKAPQPWPFRV